MNKNRQKFCPKCGHPVNLKERTCPHCGFDLAKYFNRELPTVRRNHGLALLKKCSWRKIKRHWLVWTLLGLIVIFVLVGGYVAKNRSDVSIGSTPAQTLSRRLPRYSWIVTNKKQEGGVNDTLIEFFNGRRNVLTGANPLTLKMCDQLSSSSQARNKLNRLVKHSHNRYRISGDSIKINGHDSVKHVKKVGRHYEFVIAASNGKKMREVMKPYKKIQPKLNR